MNAEPRIEFRDEELVAFVCGAGSEVTNARVNRALPSDDELRAHVAFLQALMPHGQTNRRLHDLHTEPREAACDTINLAVDGETVAGDRASADPDSRPRTRVRGCAYPDLAGIDLRL